MKWLEGWFGTLSGVLGIVSAVIASLVAVASVAQTSGSVCATGSDGQTVCSPSYGPVQSPPPPVQTNVPLLILIALILLLFIGVLVGTWLDLSGRRWVGRLILLTSVSMLLMAWLLFGRLAWVFPQCHRRLCHPACPPRPHHGHPRLRAPR